MTNEQKIELVIEQVKPFYCSLDAQHNMKHGGRVVSFAKQLNEAVKADPFLVEAGAWLHQYNLAMHPQV